MPAEMVLVICIKLLKILRSFMLSLFKEQNLVSSTGKIGKSRLNQLNNEPKEMIKRKQEMIEEELSKNDHTPDPKG